MEDTYIYTTESTGLEFGYDGGIGTPVADAPIGYDGGIGVPVPDTPTMNEDLQQYSSMGSPAPSLPAMNQDPPQHHMMASSVQNVASSLLNAMGMNQNPPQHNVMASSVLNVASSVLNAMGMNQNPPQHHVMASSVLNSTGMNQNPPQHTTGMNQNPPQHTAMGMNQNPPQHTMGMNQRPPQHTMGMNQRPPQHTATGMNQNPPQHTMGMNQRPPQHTATGMNQNPSQHGMNQRPAQQGQQPVMGSPVQQYMHHLGGQYQHSPVDMTKVGKPWSSGLFDFGKNENNAVMTAFFPCVTFGQIAEILDEGQTTCTLGSFMYIAMAPALLTCWILGSNYRAKLRKRYNLVEAPAEDWTVHLFCPCCALCQEFRELQNQGIDPSLGWMGHLAQQQQTITTPPNGQFMTQ